MALVVETGAGLTNSDSYISLADATAYHAARARDAWAEADDTTREAALVRATADLDYWFRGRWKGTKATYEQALAWPRTDVVDEEGFDVPLLTVPAIVKRAAAEVALIELTEAFIQETVDRSNMVSSESVGPISINYKDGAPAIKLYPHIDAMLRGLAAAGGVQLALNIGVTTEELEHDETADVFSFEDYFNIIKYP